MVNKQPHIQVACAVLSRDGRILATQRSATMRMPLKWEFPGGKLEPGESVCDCLHRELYEELGVQVELGGALQPVTHHYADFTVTLHPYRAAIVAGDPVLHEHAAARWLLPEELGQLDWAEADLPIIEALLEETWNI